jgi:ABC-type lipoprotein release transport system permease subunit
MMNLHYLVNELYYHKRRTLTAIIGLSIGLALLIVINALSLAYHDAARAPLREIGADITVQRSGNVPKELAGPVFPCSAVTISSKDVKKIAELPGVKGVGKAVLLWIFDPHRAWIVLGIERENTIGPTILRNAITSGRVLEEGKQEALVEAGYARQFTIKIGDLITIAGRT